MHRIEVNVQTGEQQQIDLTPEEISAAQAQSAAWEAYRQANPPQPDLATIVAQQQDTINALIARLDALAPK